MIPTTYTSNSDSIRETRTPVRLPQTMPAGLFPGWGPKF